MLRLRPFIPKDSENIVTWFDCEEAFRLWSADRYPNFPVGGEEICRQYEEASADGSFYAFSAFDESGIAGHFTLRFPDETLETARLGFIVIDQNRRGQGLGREMLTLGISYAFDFLKVERITLGVFEKNISARKCYESLGFHRNRKEHPSLYPLCGEKWLCLELELTIREWREKESLEQQGTERYN